MQLKYNNRSLFSRIREHLFNNGHYNKISELDTQYRMHPEIFCWYNEYFYNRNIKNCPITEQNTCLFKPFVVFNLINTTEERWGSGNYFNQNEATFIFKLVTEMMKLEPYEKHSYSIVTPFTKQRDTIFKLIPNKASVDVVDSLQGKERDIMLYSHVRTTGNVELKRIYSMFTRAKLCLILVGKFERFPVKVKKIYKCSNQYVFFLFQIIPFYESIISNAKMRGYFYTLDSIENLKALDYLKK